MFGRLADTSSCRSSSSCSAKATGSCRRRDLHHDTVMPRSTLRALFPADVENEGERLDIGTVLAAANAEKAHYNVKLDSGDTGTLTFEELTKVALPSIAAS